MYGHNQSRPLIGVTLDWQESGSFSKRPHYALREHYFEAIYAAGGLPIAIPYIENARHSYIDIIDGLVVPGGDFAFPDDWYIEGGSSPFAPSKRLDSDIKYLKMAVDKDIPVLAICAGMQILGCLYGCKLTSDISKVLDAHIDHLDAKPAEEYAHDVSVTKGSILNSIAGRQLFSVNTAHCEAICQVSDNVLVSGRAPDGVIEAIELKDKRFVLGVQWHPEFFYEKGDINHQLFTELVSRGLAQCAA